jgi:hypothetical protein
MKIGRIEEITGDGVGPKIVYDAAHDPRMDSSALHTAIRNMVLAGDKKSFDKLRAVARLVQENLIENGKFLRTDDGRTFFFHHKERKLYDLEQTPFRHLLTGTSGLSATENFFRFTLDVLQAHASRGARLARVHTFAKFDIDTGFLAVSDGASGVWVRERGGDWEFCLNGENDLLFLTDSSATAWIPVFAGDRDALRGYLDQFMFADAPLTAHDCRTLLLVWLLQQFFPALQRTRMIPAFLGPQGSGKTTGERLIGRLLVGQDFDVTGVQREREDALIAAITNRVMVGLDNADSKIPFLPDALARYATSQRYQLRRLYTTNEECSFSPRAILMISSRDPRFNRPDVAERLLPFNFDRPRAYRPEFEIFSELEKHRGAVMGALLGRAAQIADALPEHPPKPLAFRMADFGSFGERVSASLGGGSGSWIELLGRLGKAQSQFASDGDGLVAALAEVHHSENIIEMAVVDLFHKCAAVADAKGFLFPRSCQSFGQRLSTMRRVLEIELGVLFQEKRGHGGLRVVSFIPRNGDDGGDGDAFSEKEYERG